MKNLYKTFLSFLVIFIINILIQTPSYSHGLQSLLSTISFFSNANASDHTAEKVIIKEFKSCSGERFNFFEILYLWVSTVLLDTPEILAISSLE